MKSLLVHIELDDQLNARLAVALDLAREFGAHLTCLQATQFGAYAAFSDMGGMMVTADLIASLEAEEKKTRDQVEARLAKEDVPWSYIRARDDPARAILQHAELMDLIIMTRQKPVSLANMMTLGDVLMDADVPLLVLAEPAKEFNLNAPAMIAWNSSRESARAIRRALPMLKRASSVHLVSVKEDKETLLPSMAASQYLSRHGIKSQLHELQAAKDEISQALQTKAQSLKAAYVVLGAYGHSRAREFFFGGVSRDLLKSASLPLLMSH
jgi:nucleotide-binding universal stress UspA family protein